MVRARRCPCSKHGHGLSLMGIIRAMQKRLPRTLFGTVWPRAPPPVHLPHPPDARQAELDQVSDFARFLLTGRNFCDNILGIMMGIMNHAAEAQGSGSRGPRGHHPL